MGSNAGATTQETSPRNSTFSAEAGIKPTPQANDFAVVSEHISTIGDDVDKVRSSIMRDVRNFEKCEPDIVRQELYARCTGLHRVFEPERGFSGGAMAEDTQLDLELYLKFDKCVTCIGIRGRATTEFPVQRKALSGLQLDPHFRSPEPVTNLYWPEETRQSEPDILNEVHKIAQTDPDASCHVPGLVLVYKFKGTSTSKIRITSGLQDAEQAKPGSRALTIIVSRKLLPITVLSGKEFLAAWWQIVKCHRALWIRGVSHWDVSPSNLMVYRLGGQFIGVLNDYDLSSLSLKRDGPTGLERTGTVPFMAVNLLTPKAITGEAEHLYAHDAESFIWVLTWVCLRYEGGKLLSKNRPLEEWLKLDVLACAKAKTHFWSVRLSAMSPSESHEVSWRVIQKSFMKVHLLYTPMGYDELKDDEAFKLLLEDPMQGHL